MLFFTNDLVDVNRFVLLNIKDYPNDNDFREIVFIDPSVYELKNRIEYSNIYLMEHLLEKDELKNNEYISIDYPCDMLEGKRQDKYRDLFVEKSIENNLKYKNNEQYICTIQFQFKDWRDFYHQFDYLKEQIDFSRKIVGIGNLCRVMGCANEFMSKVKKKLIKEAGNMKWIHFYGVGMRVMRYLINDLQKSNKDLIISVDSTKWTKAVHSRWKRKRGVCCTNHNRNLYFLKYIQTLKLKYQIPTIY